VIDAAQQGTQKEPCLFHADFNHASIHSGKETVQVTPLRTTLSVFSLIRSC